MEREEICGEGGATEEEEEEEGDDKDEDDEAERAADMGREEAEAPDE